MKCADAGNISNELSAVSRTSPNDLCPAHRHMEHCGFEILQAHAENAYIACFAVVL